VGGMRGANHREDGISNIEQRVMKNEQKNSQQRNDDLRERLIEFAVRVRDIVESFPNSIPSFPSSLLARYSIFHLVAADRPRWDQRCLAQIWATSSAS